MFKRFKSQYIKFAIKNGKWNLTYSDSITVLAFLDDLLASYIYKLVIAIIMDNNQDKNFGEFLSGVMKLQNKETAKQDPRLRKAGAIYGKRASNVDRMGTS